jgi:hypothetical protein
MGVLSGGGLGGRAAMIGARRTTLEGARFVLGRGRSKLLRKSEK